jgi:hypothetical protein
MALSLGFSAFHPTRELREKVMAVSPMVKCQASIDQQA